LGLVWRFCKFYKNIKIYIDINKFSENNHISQMIDLVSLIDKEGWRIY